MDALGAAQLERVRGDLHRAGDVAGVEHLAERALEVDRLGVVRSIARRSPPTIEATVPSRPLCIPAASSIARVSQAVVVLPLVPGDADDPQLPRRLAVEARGGLRHRRAHVLDLHLRHAEPERPADDERRRATLDRVGREVVAVAGEAGDAEEQRPGLDLAVVEGEARDLDVGAVAEQLAQRHVR